MADQPAPVQYLPAPGRSNTQTAVLLAALGVGGYLAYQYIYVPYRFRQLLAKEAAAAGMSQPDYLARIGSAACQAYGASNGVPPGVSAGVCNELAKAAEQVVKALPEILQGVGTGVGAVGKGVGTAVGAIGSGVASGATAVAVVPLNVIDRAGSEVKSGAQNLYAGAKTVVSDVAGGIKSGVKSIFGLGGTNCSVAQQPENAMWCRQKFGYASAPGSDAWAKAHGMTPLYTGRGST